MPLPDTHAEPVEWRRLSARLWVGRRDGLPIGMIERGRRYTATDASERPRGSFRTLAQAQAALTTRSPAPGLERAEGERRPEEPPTGRVMLFGTSTVALVAATMATVGMVAFV